ncbi:MAG: putative cAMP-dependent protein kinase catalytic subunit [Streblomastix strix]|uniref:Putative cAMP-dependent protein kinase catalytic subunit n=1 Tax=Streblomastix strix TaxID=222440 RepID=A0A5J4W258_9EUKA|nr:MAG: putative cAMP-dependent protein kinase catalytic subunit [Streblomastix strix]
MISSEQLLDQEMRQLLESERFQIIKKIGHGAFGQVFLVHHPNLEEEFVAAKVIMNEEFDMNEWDSAGILSQDRSQISPFIVRNIRAKQFDKMTVILMEYSNLGTLFDLIKTNKNLPIPMIRVIMRQILQGLSYIHSKGLIHRDIKGGNILLHNPIGSGRVILKIADFGVAKTKTGNGVNIQVTVIGTEPYMAPEFILGDGQEKVIADAKVDIWSLGMLLYKILTHEFPFKINSLVDQHQFMANAVLIRPQAIADNILWDFLQKMLQFDRNKRISAADALNHQFFTGKQAEREITIEQNQLSQIAQAALINGDSTVTQFDTKPTFVLPLTINQKRKKKNLRE